MSRRRRGRTVPPAPIESPPERPVTPRGPQPPSGAVPAPSGPTIRVNISKMEIPDLVVLARFAKLSSLDEDAQLQAVADAIPMLERVVVGGLAGRSIDQLGAVMQAVNDTMTGRANRGN